LKSLHIIKRKEREGRQSGKMKNHRKRKKTRSQHYQPAMLAQLTTKKEPRPRIHAGEMRNQKRRRGLGKKKKTPTRKTMEKERGIKRNAKGRGSWCEGSKGVAKTKGQRMPKPSEGRIGSRLAKKRA